MTLELLVTRTEDNQLMPKKFAKLSFYEADPSTLLVESAAPNEGRYQDQINDSYTPLALANQYVEAIQMLHRYFQGIVSHKWNLEDLFQKLLLAKFTYASPAAYQLIIPGVAHYNGKYGIFVSLPEDKTLADVKMYSIHELGHFMHHVDSPDHYGSCDETMREALAILLEEEEGTYEYNNLPSNTTHGRARQLLRKANETKFKGKTFAQEWNLLKKFLKSEEFEDYLDDKHFIL